MADTVTDNATLQKHGYPALQHGIAAPDLIRGEQSRATGALGTGLLRRPKQVRPPRNDDLFKQAQALKNVKQNGFSLVELMVVIFIIGLLATIVAINVLPAQDTASVTSARANIKQLEQAIELYRLDTNRYPGTNEGLAALKTPPASLGANTRFPPGGYFRGALPNDPWGNAYQYVTPGPNGLPYAVYSLGADGAPGGTELNADVYGNE